MSKRANPGNIQVVQYVTYPPIVVRGVRVVILNVDLMLRNRCCHIYSLYADDSDKDGAEPEEGSREHTLL